MSCLKLNRVAFEREDVPLFSDVTAEWQSGTVIQLAGHNGCGKTTLLRIIAGLLQCSSGSVSWCDDLGKTHTITSHEFKFSCLYLGHQVGVKATMTPEENLRWYFGLNGQKKPPTRAELAKTELPLSTSDLRSALLSVGLRGLEDIPCHQLSAGQQRRAALARLKLSKAPLWILDEPFTAIDKKGVEDLEHTIEAHAMSGGIVLLTTHQRWNSKLVKTVNLEQYKCGIEL